MTKNYSEFVSQLPSKLKYSSDNQDTSIESNDSSLKDEMNASLDKRLLELKKSNQLIFKSEMKLQKEFNSSIAKYCGFYKSKCEGTVCSLCINNCYSSFYRYRKEQSDKINSSSLQLSQSSILHTNVKKYFTEFAKGICSMPEDIWKNTKKPKKCLEDILGDINKEVISSFYFNLETEGDVCAQLE